jgi:hypothetical protein
VNPSSARRGPTTTRLDGDQHIVTINGRLFPDTRPGIFFFFLTGPSKRLDAAGSSAQRSIDNDFQRERQACGVSLPRRKQSLGCRLALQVFKGFDLSNKCHEMNYTYTTLHPTLKEYRSKNPIAILWNCQKLQHFTDVHREKMPAFFVLIDEKGKGSGNAQDGEV